jgi:hypothetical protein
VGRSPCRFRGRTSESATYEHEGPESGCIAWAQRHQRPFFITFRTRSWSSMTTRSGRAPGWRRPRQGCSSRSAGVRVIEAMALTRSSSPGQGPRLELQWVYSRPWTAPARSGWSPCRARSWVLLGGGTPVEAGAAQILVLMGILAARALTTAVLIRVIAHARILRSDLVLKVPAMRG